MKITDLRRQYHQNLCRQIVRADKGYPNFADGSNKASSQIAWGIVNRLQFPLGEDVLTGQTAGNLFELLTMEFIQKSFELLHHLRPGKWHYTTLQTEISRFEQYAHLADLAAAIERDANLASSLGGDYIVKPDIVIARWPVSDQQINQHDLLIAEGETIAGHTPLRQVNRLQSKLILHAIISCKWTIRSDRSQNTRTEALNLIRNRKGHLPHVVVVTSEPLPTRLAALALGTGDLDCVYHLALPELEAAIREIDNQDQLDMLTTLVAGNRLRDISDLPFDLAI